MPDISISREFLRSDGPERAKSAGSCRRSRRAGRPPQTNPSMRESYSIWPTVDQARDEIEHANSIRTQARIKPARWIQPGTVPRSLSAVEYLEVFAWLNRSRSILAREAWSTVGPNRDRIRACLGCLRRSPARRLRRPAAALLRALRPSERELPRC